MKITNIEVNFPVEVEVTNEFHKLLDEALTKICEHYVKGNPGRVMWVFGTGAKMLSNPFMVGDDEPLQFDESTLHFEIAEREDYSAHEWGEIAGITMCKKCGWMKGGKKASEPCKGSPGISLRGESE
jgi:hypothetical protein